MPQFVVNYRIGDQDAARPWGNWRTLNVGHLPHRGDLAFCDKLLIVEPGKSLSIQRHDWREELWFLHPASAAATVRLGMAPDQLQSIALQPGATIHIPAGAWHALANPSTVQQLKLHERQIGPLLDENDNHRYPTAQDPRETDIAAIRSLADYARTHRIDWPATGPASPLPPVFPVSAIITRQRLVPGA